MRSYEEEILIEKSTPGVTGFSLFCRNKRNSQ